MFFVVIECLTGIVLFDDVFESFVLPDESQLYDVVTELVPLQTLVAVDVDVLRSLRLP